jgi:amidase
MTAQLYKMTAREAVLALKRGDVSPAELIDASLARIAATGKSVNALPTLCPERARKYASRVSRESLLAGLPIAIKDLVEVADVRTTWGSPIFADHLSQRSDIVVEILERNGGVVIAKSNTPEFGAGGNTFNEVFGPTRNPWNTALTAGGSSGGAAVALATGQVWLANGSDLGGSLRTPASFCGVVGLRPSPGLVAHGPKTDAFDTLAVEGPMARNVGDLALMLDAMVGTDPGDPLASAPPARSFSAHVAAPRMAKRIAFSADLGGVPVAREIKEICARAVEHFETLGAAVEEACPDLRDAGVIFQTLRAAKFVTGHAEKLAKYRDRLKPEMIWNIEKGLKLTAEDIGRATRARSALVDRVAAFFADFDLLACPASSVPPFPVEERYVAEIEGRKFDNYMDWLAIAFPSTLAGCPAISVPCGFTRDGRPVAIQIIARPRGEAALLEAAILFEADMDLAQKLPIDPRIRHS